MKEDIVLLFSIDTTRVKKIGMIGQGNEWPTAAAMPGLSVQRLMIRSLTLHHCYVMKIIRKPIAAYLMSGWPIMNDWVLVKSASEQLSSGVNQLIQTGSGEKALSGQLSGSCSDQIQRIFTAQDLMEGLRDESVFLEKSFWLIPDHKLGHVFQLENGNWAVKSALLKQTRGFQFVGNIDSLVGTLVAGCDWQRLVGEMVNNLTLKLGVASENIAPDCIGIIRELFEKGFLVASK